MSIQHNENQDRFVNESEAAEILGFSKNTLRAWRVTGRPNRVLPPRFVKCGRAVRYRMSDLLAWMDAQAHVRSTSELGGVA